MLSHLLSKPLCAVFSSHPNGWEEMAGRWLTKAQAQQEFPRWPSAIAGGKGVLRH